MSQERPLSESEMRRLDELAQQLARDDPRFVRRLHAGTSLRRRAVVTFVLALVGAVILVAGLVTTAISVLAGACFAVAGVIVLAVSGWRAVHVRQRSG